LLPETNLRPSKPFSGHGPLLLVASPIIHPEGPGAHPVDVESSNISEKSDRPNFEEKPFLGTRH